MFGTIKNKCVHNSLLSLLPILPFLVAQIALACLIASHHLQICCSLSFACLLPCSTRSPVGISINLGNRHALQINGDREADRVAVASVKALRSVHCHKCGIKYRHPQRFANLRKEVHISLVFQVYSVGNKNSAMSPLSSPETGNWKWVCLERCFPSGVTCLHLGHWIWK